MSALTKSTPSAAQELINQVPRLYPGGKVVWHGVVEPDGKQWHGQKAMYLVAVWHSGCQPGRADAHWFELDILDVSATVVAESPSLPPADDKTLTIPRNSASLTRCSEGKSE